MNIRVEVWPFLLAVAGVCGATMFALCWRKPLARRVWLGSILAAMTCAVYLLYFFRDPHRVTPHDPFAVVAGADGRVTAVEYMREERYLHADCVRISIFLSLFDVHVNRAPISGRSTFLGYFPGKRLFTFQEKSSEVNQHNKILIEGERTRCLVCQIVGPVCRRVVYWPPHNRAVSVAMGERIGMMKFGSRLDMILPAEGLEVLAAPGDTVRAGETVVARLEKRTSQNL